MNYVSVAQDECIVRECVFAVYNASENVRDEIINRVLSKENSFAADSGLWILFGMDLCLLNF